MALLFRNNNVTGIGQQIQILPWDKSDQKYALLRCPKRYHNIYLDLKKKNIRKLNKRLGVFLFDIFRHQDRCRSPPHLFAYKNG